MPLWQRRDAVTGYSRDDIASVRTSGLATISYKPL